MRYTMLKKSTTPEEVVELLNEMLKLDYEATKKFIETKVSCNENLANNSLIQVDGYSEKDGYLVGPLGFLNGIFGDNEYGYGCICAVYEDKNLVKFECNSNLKDNVD